MQAIRQIAQVVGHRVTIELPSDFAAKTVEVIVLSLEEATNGQATPLDPAVQEFLELDTSAFTPQQLEAYERVVTHIHRERRADEPYPLGLFAGLVEITDDFDAPLLDEELWYGADTDEYGVSVST